MTTALLTTEPKVASKVSILVVRLKAASDLESTVLGKEFQTLTSLHTIAMDIILHDDWAFPTNSTRS